jgi:hypothetical protein
LVNRFSSTAFLNGEPIGSPFFLIKFSLPQMGDDRLFREALNTISWLPNWSKLL